MLTLFILQFASCTNDRTGPDDLASVMSQMKRLESQDQSFETHINGLESHIIGLESHVIGLEQTVQEMKVDNTKLENQVTCLKRDHMIQLDLFKNDLDKLQHDFNTYRTGKMRILLAIC